jgi:TrmH family RNA methyltransferase
MITSAQNAKVKLARSLMGRAKERREAGAFVVEGVRLVEEAVKANWPVRFVLFDETLSERGRWLLKNMPGAEEVSTGVMESISETESPQGILAVLEDKLLPMPESPSFILVPDQVRDPGNLGTLLRTAAASGVQAVLIPPDTTDVFAPKVLRSGMGAHFRLPIHSMGWDEIETQIKGIQVYIADMDGHSCWETDLHQPLALVIGSEAVGVSAAAQKIANGRISIPMSGDIESLNAGVAGSVLMFEVLRQRRAS